MLGILFLTTCLQAAEKDSVKFVAKGIVVNKNKQPLYGACVMVKNSNERIYTGVDGKFSLAVKKGTKLVVSLLGKMDKEIRAKVDKEMQVVLIDEEYIEERMPRFVGEGVEMYIVRNIKISERCVGDEDSRESLRAIYYRERRECVGNKSSSSRLSFFGL